MPRKRGKRVTLVGKGTGKYRSMADMAADKAQMEDWLSKNEPKKLPTLYAWGYTRDAGDVIGLGSGEEKSAGTLVEGARNAYRNRKGKTS